MTGTPRYYEVLIVGAGQAGAQVAAELVTAGHPGPIGLLGAEDVPPYQRPPLSKGFLAGTEEFADLLLRPADFWDARGLDLRLGCEVVGVDAAARTVTTADGELIGYGALVWAAGGSPRALPVPGADLPGVHFVRTLRDAEALKAALPTTRNAGAPAKPGSQSARIPGPANTTRNVGAPAKPGSQSAHVPDPANTARNAVVIGGGFVGLEAAAAFVKAGLTVTVVEAADRVLGRVTCGPVSAHCTAVHRAHGVTVLTGTGVREIAGAGGRVSGVVLGDGRVLPADLVVVGIGLVPAVGPLRAAGAAGADGVDVDGEGRTSLPGVYAAGDCAATSNAYTGGRRMRLESVQNAVEQGRAVARAILGVPQPPTPPVPWFWSNQYDVRFKTMGVPVAYDTAVVRGEPASGRFSVVYLRDGEVAAVDTIDNVRDYAQAKALIGVRADAADLADPSVPLKELARRETVHEH
ncbi:3-phenylpropionate/trans-cinnamate dioxygenase ferredoxin reductase subunit [Actinocorallia herbida]|uniref:3-phenylpropionate/trans-cinnamate dioxygenase ferredoxin reductase subunit n=1 Tax=Actinocorallia herbida TaxID=58109 RepID=A0A3N1CWI4_9ACTN|nr:FAD-dependent oxidoreductase [Actinocorallia herbida]ROO85659.1 3-phenylpropionate/trans-cinnamate dioxygenase ferredoxin reductase subunit [Actinocorallia herbida]